MTRVIRVAAALSALVLLAGITGCASVRARTARTQRLQAELDAHRYAEPIDQVWLEARRLLADRRFPLAEDDAKAVGQKEMGFPEKMFSPAKSTRPLEEGAELVERMGASGSPASVSGRTLDTGWGPASPRERRHLEAITDGARVRVNFWRVVEDAADRSTTTERDLELELELARRLEPASAERIEAAAAAAAK